MTLTQRELAGLQACSKSPRGYYWMKPTMLQLERKGLVYGMPGNAREGRGNGLFPDRGRAAIPQDCSENNQVI